MLCALIMAGGKGTRFWPLSTEEKPKQFLRLLGKDTMIQMTVKRLDGLIPLDRTFIVTSENYVHYIKEQLPNLPERNIIIEPEGRNTAPCIALSAFYIDKIYKDATLVVLPADHLIINEEKFRETINSGYEFIEKNEGSIVTIGIKPDRPETGYGYIKTIKNKQSESNNIYKVEKFVEKPDEQTAKRYLDEGNYLWNGGMFIWKAINILKLTKKYLKNTFDALSEIASASDEEYERVLKEKYENVDCISIDYGIMEKVDNIYVIPGDFGWDDVGTWNSVLRYRKKDINNNICMGGKIINIDGKNNIAVSNGKLIVIAGIDNTFVVEGDEAIVITSKENMGNIKNIKSSIG